VLCVGYKKPAELDEKAVGDMSAVDVVGLKKSLNSL